MSMTNKELLILLEGILAEHAENGFPLNHDSAVALMKLTKALFGHTTPEHQIDTISRMKILIDPRAGFKIKKPDAEILDEAVTAMEARTADSSMSLEDAKCFTHAVRMAIMRLEPDKEACSCLQKLVEALR